MFRPQIAVTLGDPRGVGPEVACQAIDTLTTEGFEASFFIVGPHGVTPRDEVGSGTPAVGMSDAQAGSESAGSIERAVAMALAGEVHAVVTGPVHKPSLRAAGWDVPGQTEMLAALSGSPRVGMLMAAERTRFDAPLRVLLATTHLALRDVPDAVDESLLVAQAELLDDALRRDWGIERPRLALCAFNPHASDGGLFGSEEALVFAPALTRLREAGLCVEGPIPADTVFSRALAGEFDAVVAPYHDVGMAAFKTVAFGAGVNVTIGLPFVRTSPDHGTAFDIAGTGRADRSSMLHAVRLAARLANARFDMSQAHV
ncbi:MAG: 4-hydroxythreonine-4-phosphate dehydrogenase PdxA [Gemmatimonadota bacterium]|nr:4-hydroxythreonine-4-phosphate dehydrogenase PdxA [Gemmatimonadota bacterium]